MDRYFIAEDTPALVWKVDGDHNVTVRILDDPTDTWDDSVYTTEDLLACSDVSEIPVEQVPA